MTYLCHIGRLRPRAARSTTTGVPMCHVNVANDPVRDGVSAEMCYGAKCIAPATRAKPRPRIHGSMHKIINIQRAVATKKAEAGPVSVSLSSSHLSPSLKSVISKSTLGGTRQHLLVPVGHERAGLLCEVSHMRCSSKPSSDILTSVSYQLPHQPAKSTQPMLVDFCEAPSDGDEYDQDQADRLVTEDESGFHSCFRPLEFVSAPCK